MSETDISVIVPVYNEVESLPELCLWIERIMTEHDFTYEVLLIDDGSEDGSWEQINSIHQKNSRFKGLKFNRNFGKSAALQTGFRACSGKVIITMDADMQDSPDEIPGLYKIITEQGYHLVSGWKKKRNDPVSKTIPSKFFNYVTRVISGIKLHDFNCGLKAYQNKVVKNISVYGEMHRYIPLIAKWNGFNKITEKVVEHRARKFGHTKYGFRRFITGFLDLISIVFVSRFREKPMHFFGTMGTLSFLLGFIFTVKIFWEKLDALYISKVPVKREVIEQPLFFLALVALVIGVQLFLTGFLAEMVSMRSMSKRDYLIVDRIGLKGDEN